MRPAAQLLAPGFFRRSLDEFKRLSNIGEYSYGYDGPKVLDSRRPYYPNLLCQADSKSNAAIRQEGLTVPSRPYHLLDLTDPSAIESCKTMSDADMGGFSKVSLEHTPKTATEPAHVRFHGNISIELPPNRPHIQRTGYAAWRNKDRPGTLFGKALWDIDPYTYLGLRVKSDGRKYFVNVQTETIVPTDLHQHRLYARRPGEWETVLIKWNDFVRTNHGVVVEPQKEMLRQKVRTVGIGLIDRVPGPFDLAISRIWATNNGDEGKIVTEEKPLSEEEIGEESRRREPELQQATKSFIM